MMKNKALTYALLVVVGIIWYQVFFRVKNNLTAEDGEIPNPNQAEVSVNAIARDTVDLHLNYRDPFRYQKMAIPVTLSAEPRATQNTNAAPRRTSKPQFAWPSISYYGLIRNRMSEKPLALIRVDGMVYNLRPGDEIFNGIYIKSIEPDLLTISHKKLSKTIDRQ